MDWTCSNVGCDWWNATVQPAMELNIIIKKFYHESFQKVKLTKYNNDWPNSSLFT